MTKNLPTIWEVPDALWSIIESILNTAYPPKPVLDVLEDYSVQYQTG